MLNMENKLSVSSHKAPRCMPVYRTCRDLLTQRQLKHHAQCLGGSQGDRTQLLVERARQLYECVWTEGRILLLNTIMAEDHAQIDQVWQDTAGLGRKRMKRGILAYRAAYPDIRFDVQAIAADQGDKVFVFWSACGTNLGSIREQPATGKSVQFAGISLLEFNQQAQIQVSRVFRQAPEDEMSYFLSLVKKSNDV